VWLGTYLAYLAHLLVEGSDGSEAQPTPTELAAIRLATEAADTEAIPEEPRSTTKRSILLLALATIGAVVVSEILVGTVEPVTRQLGLNEFFVGVVLVALVGNAAEHFSAVQLALRGRIDVSLAITAGSSTQI